MLPAPKHLTLPVYRADIDGLRAIAVLAVVAYHAFPSIVMGGFIGVDVFFVISGYLISTIIFKNLNTGTFSFGEFYADRIKRIFPALILVLTACLGYGWLALLPDEYRQLGKHIAGGAGFIANYLLWDEVGYFDNAAQSKPLMHLWSLGIEEQFYIAWPLMLWLGRKNWRHLLGITLAIVACSLSLASFGDDATATFYAPQTRAWELMSGGLLAWLSLYRSHTYAAPKLLAAGIRNNILSVAGLPLLFWAGGWLDAARSSHALWAIVPVTSSLVIIGTGQDAWVNRTLLSSRVMVWIGRISFPLYLWHWPLLAFAHIETSGTSGWATRLGLVALAIGLAALTYLLIEHPIRFGQASWITSHHLALAMATVCALGLTIHLTNLIRPRLAIMGSGSPALAAWDAKLRDNPDYIEDKRKDRRRTIRAPYCHFNKPGQTFDEYRQGIGDCLKINPTKPNILIIGDSHAGDLYAALAQTHPDLNLLQATGAACTPIRSSNKGRVADCRKLIDYGINFAVVNNIDTVALAANWPDNFESIRDEIDELKGHVKSIVLVGPPAEFTEDVNKFIARRSTGDDLASLSQRYLKSDRRALNRRMADFAQANEVRYLDRLSLFCDLQNVCDLISDDGDLYIWDYGHLLETGSRHLGEKLIKQRFFTR